MHSQDETRSDSAQKRNDELYGAHYFRVGCGRPYDRNESWWFTFFGQVADRIVSDIGPARVLDAGCALGFLVEELHNRGVDAHGIDISTYAIGQVRPDLRDRFRLASVTDEIHGHYELIVCIEVLEHLSTQQAEKAVENFCKHADAVLFSSTPIDFHEATHINVQPPDYWAQVFARHGMYRDVDYDASYITDWSVLFRRTSQPVGRLLGGYERKLWHLTQVVSGTRDLLLEQRRQLEQLEQSATARIQAAEDWARAESETARKRVDDEIEQIRQSHQEQVAAAAAAQPVRPLPPLPPPREAARTPIESQSPSLFRALLQAEAERDQARQALDDLNASNAIALGRFLHRVRCRLAPSGSLRARALRMGVRGVRIWHREGTTSVAERVKTRLSQPTAALEPPAPPKPVRARPFAPVDEYDWWIVRNEPDASMLAQQKKDADELAVRPLISILTPVFNTPAHLLDELVESVLDQTYPHWELCLADGGTSDVETIQTMERWTHRDPRIRVHRIEENRGISGNTNVALDIAQGEFIALLDHDDILAPFALFEVARSIQDEPDADFLYSDKDRITEDSVKRSEPLFKPVWSPEIMLSANYLTHLCIIRTSLARAIGGFRSETDGAQDWDFFLRVIEQTDRIVHIPKILYHWRVWSRSVASGIDAKPYALTAQRIAIEEHLARIGTDARVEMDYRGVIRIRRPVDPSAKVSIVVSTRGRSGLLPRLAEALVDRPSGSTAAELVIVLSSPVRPPVRRFVESLASDGVARFVEHDGEVDSPEAWNIGARAATGTALLFLADDLVPEANDWIDELAQWLRHPGVGMVGGLIKARDGLVESAGLVAGLNGLVGPVYQGAGEWDGGPFGYTTWYRNWSATSADALCIGRELFEELGGFEAAMGRIGAAFDLATRARERGQRVMVTPYAAFQRTGGSPTTEIPADEATALLDRHPEALRDNDPFFNPNLSRRTSRPSLRGPAEPAQNRRPNEWIRTLPPAPQSAAPTVAPKVPTDPYFHEARGMVSWFDCNPTQVELSRALQAASPGPIAIRSINWFIPDFSNAFYGGIYTILRFASEWKDRHGVRSRFYIIGNTDAQQIADAIARAYPNLYGETVRVIRSEAEIGTLEYADACVSTLWTTAFYALKFMRTRRKFYFIQDFEPMFYPAGSISGLVESTYRFGFYGLTNTISLREIYENDFGGKAQDFTPCVDTEIFHPADPADETPRRPGQPYRIFFYGRPNNTRNGFELGTAALRKFKERMGDKVEILGAGDNWNPADYGLDGVIKNLGMLSFEQTGDLYRSCDIGMVLMFTRHPSYLPLEFMASGCLVVTNRNPATGWLLKDGENCLLVEPTVESLADALERGLDESIRRPIVQAAHAMIRDHYTDWDRQIDRIWQFIRDPEAVDQPALPSYPVRVSA